ncbi:MAG: hypothetical protein OEU26_02100, partial [Candidatus Tectomicrobia bacterium]|nr:hypothetical protein [Candidatus Tectomicrobia bacterium]
MRHQLLSTFSKVGVPFFITISVVLLLCLRSVAHTAPAETYLLFAKGKVEVGVDTRILSGDIGSNETSDDAIRFRQGSSTSATSNIRSAKIRLGANVTVGSVFYNTLDAPPSAVILGANVDNIDLPVVADFPSIPDFSAGNDDITVAKETSLTLPAGSYDDIEVNTNGVLVLSGGDYFLNRFDLRGNAFVVVEQDTHLFIASRFEVGRETSVNYAQSPKKFAIFYAGDKTVNLRANHRVKALLLAPNAKVNIGFGAIFEGRILAKKIESQARSVLMFNPFDGSVAPPSTPDPFTLFAKSRLQVGRGSRIDAGQIGSNGTSNVAMEFQRGASTAETVMLFSDKLKLDENVVVGHAFYNAVQQHPTATIRFPSSPINLPIVKFFPDVAPFEVGTNDLKIPHRAHTTVAPGRYRNIR